MGNTILRRVNPAPKGNADVLVSGDITLDYNFRRIKVKDKIIELTGLEREVVEKSVETPPDEKMGDLAFPCFPLAK